MTLEYFDSDKTPEEVTAYFSEIVGRVNTFDILAHKNSYYLNFSNLGLRTKKIEPQGVVMTIDKSHYFLQTAQANVWNYEHNYGKGDEHPYGVLVAVFKPGFPKRPKITELMSQNSPYDFPFLLICLKKAETTLAPDNGTVKCVQQKALARHNKDIFLDSLVKDLTLQQQPCPQ